MSALGTKLTEPLLLRAALERARAIPRKHAARARELGLAARRRAAAARALRSEEHDVAALRLEQEAAALALGALLAAKGLAADGPPPPREAWARLAELELPEPPPNLEAARKILAAEAPLALDALGSDGARRARAETAATLAWLLRLAEPRTEQELRQARFARTATLAAALVGATWLGLWLFVWPANEAAHKPVAMSSLGRGSAPTEVLTDGKDDRPAVTDRQREPWARLDLLNQVAIERVAIHTAPQTSLPLILEISQDDRRFAEVATLRDAAPRGRWLVPLAKQRARFVRLRHPGDGALALSEIEVWGKR